MFQEFIGVAGEGSLLFYKNIWKVVALIVVSVGERTEHRTIDLITVLSPWFSYGFMMKSTD